jgi:hypothetical protein
VAIRLTKNLKRVIVTQFKGGDSLDYLAGIYSVSLPRIEQVIREALIEDRSVQAVQPLGGSLRSIGGDASVQAVSGSEAKQ